MLAPKSRILFLGAETEHAKTLFSHLKKLEYKTKPAESAATVKPLLGRSHFDVLIIQLDSATGPQEIARLIAFSKLRAPKTRLLVISGNEDDPRPFEKDVDRSLKTHPSLREFEQAVEDLLRP